MRIRVFHPSAGLDQGPVEIGYAEWKPGVLAIRGNLEPVFRQIGLNGCIFSGKFVEQAIDGAIFELNRHHAAVIHVLAKNPGEALADDQMDSVDLQGPRRMLPGGAAAEVGAGDDNGDLPDIPISVTPV